MTLEYLREYRIYFHISTSYGISESNCYKKIRFVEDSLIKSGRFPLPGRKALLKSDVKYEVILVDATESPAKENKEKNTDLSRKRVIVENVIGMLKRFKIISDRYRNCRKRFGLRFNLLAGLYTFELEI
jgi:hypothetical protein